MRLFLASVIALALGVGGGFAIKGWLANTITESFDEETVVETDAVLERKAPIIIVAGDGQIVDYGKIENYRTYEHVFKIANGGGQPLTVGFIDADVKVEFVNPAEKWPMTIEPQSQFHIKASWSINSSQDTFSKFIKVSSNDKTFPVMEMILNGVVRKVVTVEPEAVTLAGDADAVVRVFGNRTKLFEISAFSFEDDKMNEWVDVTLAKMDPENTKALKGALSGAELRFKLKKPADQAIDGTLIINTNLPETEPIRLPVSIPGK